MLFIQLADFYSHYNRKSFEELMRSIETAIIKCGLDSCRLIVDLSEDRSPSPNDPRLDSQDETPTTYLQIPLHNQSTLLKIIKPAGPTIERLCLDGRSRKIAQNTCEYRLPCLDGSCHEYCIQFSGKMCLLFGLIN